MYDSNDIASSKLTTTCCLEHLAAALDRCIDHSCLIVVSILQLFSSFQSLQFPVSLVSTLTSSNYLLGNPDSDGAQIDDLIVDGWPLWVAG